MNLIFTEDLDDMRYAPVFTAAEVQQLREILKSMLNNLEQEACSKSISARFWKKEADRPDISDKLWKEHSKIKEKTKKLAALQSKMKKVDVLY